MNRTLPIAFLLLLLPAAAFTARADDLDTARKAIEAQYGRLDAAISRKDPLPPEGIPSPDFRNITVHGDEFDLRLWTGVWRQSVASFETLTVRSKVESLTLEGDTAHAVVHVTFEGAGRPETMVAKMRAEQTLHDTWVKSSQQWHLHRSVEIRSKAWHDGHLAADFTAGAPLEPTRRAAVVGELRTRALPFESVAPGTGFDDLAALDKIIGDARIVALGESTHGTSEFFRMKHRLFEYLVERKGFTVFAFETNWPAVEIVERYVKTGEGTAAKAIEALHEVWRTQEVRDLIEWMRAYNSAPGRTKLLSFTGFDMQDPVTAINCVIGAFDKLGGSDAKTMRDLYTGAGPEGSSVGDTVEKAKAHFVDAAKLVEARREALGAHYERVHRCTTVALQLVQIDIGAGLTAYSDARDKAMAENVRWLAETVYPNQRIALWAHNGHIATAPEANGPVPMGQHLRQMFANQLRVVGFAFDRGEVLHIPFGASGPDAGKAIAVKVPPASLASAEAMLKGAGLPRFILDLRTVPVGSALGTWLAQPLKLRRMGWGGVASDDPASAYPTVALYDTLVLPNAFDALVYIEASTATALLK